MNHSSCVTPVVDGNTLYWQGVEYVRVALGEDGPGQTLYEFGTPEWWASAITSGMLVLCAGLVAGLTMGFVSLDATYIDIQCKTGSPAEKRRAMKLRWFAHHHHLVLVTLLLGNSLCNEALPIFLHHIVNEVVSIILSVTLILFFGEIIPSAIFTGPSQMKIASAMVYPLWALIGLFFILSWPISKLLDCTCLGEDHAHRYRRTELKEFIKLHEDESANAIELPETGVRDRTNTEISSEQLAQEGAMGAFVVARGAAGTNKSLESHFLSKEEVTIISGTLEMKDKTVAQYLVPLAKTFMVSMDDRMDRSLVSRILATTHSRIPVYRGKNKHDIAGLILVKLLVELDPSDCVPVSSIDLCPPLVMHPDTPLLTALKLFQSGVCHMALVTRFTDELQDSLSNDLPVPPNVEIMGIITIEDVLEQLIQGKIEDETDRVVRVVGPQTFRRFDSFRNLFKRPERETSLSVLPRPNMPPLEPSPAETTPTSSLRQSLLSSGTSSGYGAVSTSQEFKRGRAATGDLADISQDESLMSDAGYQPWSKPSKKP